MSRWGRGRGGSVAVPLDSALFRENSNCPSAARSAGTVGKWGMTSFTSIRSAPYAYNNAKKPVQDQNSPLTVPAVDTEQPPPKPKKFFKSRNAETFPPVPQIAYAPQQVPPLSPEHPPSFKEKKSTKRCRYNRDSSSPELPRRNSEKTKTKKTTVATKASKKEEPTSDNSQPPNKRYLVRNRSKVINYAEDGSNSPIPDMTTRYESLPPRAQSPKASPLISSPVPAKPVADVVSPSTSKELNEERKPPPIVLRISKGTSRIVSTDSNEGFTSPGSDRHSSMDMHSDLDHKKSPSMETICSPKHEGLKITIKCSSLNQENKKEKKKDKKEGHHKSHKRHHKNSDDEPLKKASSPLPGTDTYDLYKTLASPVHEEESNTKTKAENVEAQLAKIISTDSTTKPKTESKALLPEPKQPEGRSRRNRPNINYSENDDYLDVLTSKVSNKNSTKTVSDIKKDVRKSKRRLDVAATPDSNDVNEIHSETEKEAESHYDDDDLINILSGDNDKIKSNNDLQKAKVNKKQKNKQKQQNSTNDIQSPNPEDSLSVPQLDESYDEDEHLAEEPRSDDMDYEDDGGVQEEKEGESQTEKAMEQQERNHPSDLQPGSQMEGQGIDSNEDLCHNTPTQSSDSAYNSCPNENSEEESQRNIADDHFKAPNGVNELDGTDDKPSVKLVITKKKGSIFKSKSLVNDNPSPLPARKRRHLYRHQWANDKGNETPRPDRPENPEVSNPVRQVPEALTRVTRYRSPDPIIAEIDAPEPGVPYTSVRCAKEAKEYYTVVRNVKKAHQIQEIGEFQEFNDDVEYLLDALQDNNPMSTRCLSAITLASKCTAPAFRMHLRAHGTVQKFFSALHDATNDQSLGLCTATVMFVLSQDRLNMDLDRESLELMLNLLESDVSHKNALDDCGLTSAQLAKTQERVRELCAEIKSQGKATHLDLENITVGHLAMETLLSLTSKRAGEWFKEELRVLGGVDHIVRTIQDCAARLHAPATAWSSAEVDVLRKADRCMRVLENVTQQNEDNQVYLVGEPLGGARTLAALLRRCVMEAREQPALRPPLLDAALPALKVLVNLSHSFGSVASIGAQVVGEQPYIMETCLIMLYNQGCFIPDNNNFEFSVCVLLLLINLVQNNESNTQKLLDVHITVDNGDTSTNTPALDLIVDLFYKREELARRAEENTDALLDGEKEETDDEKDKKKQSVDDIAETVDKLLARAGAHMEHTMVCAYIALLLGHAASCARAPAAAVRERVPRYEPLLPTLRKYYTFLSLTASAEASIVAHVKATQRIIEFMETSDKESSQDTPQQPPAEYPRPYGNYYQPCADLPQDMSLSNLNYTMNSSSSSDRMSSSMDVDGYH
ncbi:PREDICTED: protein wings apart-like [Papilio xuthus]|uniref:Protein wings apart-like n=1 Tax=Papilio xuthus TaxID=66420 RepID=A0AAJ6ZJR1_PAPXU|nr:PREDICTED: protein wings apart-like [Papilio xuthus]XP_013173968.1 PREDICTED: protein wings apart-like [Papilio xuthus]